MARVHSHLLRLQAFTFCLTTKHFVDSFQRLSFDLIVGLDAVTNDDAIDAIKTYQRIYPKFRARALVRKDKGGIFHVKMCYFRKGLRGTSVVGSGNLTAEGLRGNCEAYSIASLSQDEVHIVDNLWRSWTEFHTTDLLPLDHPEVVKLAKKNGRAAARANRVVHGVLNEGRKGKFYVSRPQSKTSEVLIAEIPKSGTRWNQANFDLQTFTAYFGAHPGKTQRIILTHIDSSGVLGDPFRHYWCAHVRFSFTRQIEFNPAGSTRSKAFASRNVWRRTRSHRLPLLYTVRSKPQP